MSLLILGAGKKPTSGGGGGGPTSELAFIATGDGSLTLSDSNRTMTKGGSWTGFHTQITNIGLTTGKWFWEVKVSASPARGNTCAVAVADAQAGSFPSCYIANNGACGAGSTGNETGWGTSPSNTFPQYMLTAIDLSTDKLWGYLNGYVGSGGGTNRAGWGGVGSAADDPLNGVGGGSLASLGATVYPAIGIAEVGDIMTINNGYSVPFDSSLTAEIALLRAAGFKAVGEP